MKAVITAALLFLAATLSYAQEFPRAEVFGGYSYLNIDTNGFTDRQSANGWEASVSVNVNKWAAVEGDVAGYYKNDIFGSGVNGSVHTFTGGPRINVRPFFVHALFGADRLSASLSGISASQNSFTMALGGGAQFKVAPNWAVRGSVDYLRTHHNLASFGGPDLSQNNVRVGAGIVYLIGSHRHEGESAPRAEVASGGCVPSTGARAVTLDQLGISGDNRSAYGFYVTSVAPGSAAAKANLAAGDVLVTVNCLHVKTAADVQAALSHSGTTVALSISKPGSINNYTETRELQLGQ
jgi:opacity protein-like surface antigen